MDASMRGRLLYACTHARAARSLAARRGSLASRGGTHPPTEARGAQVRPQCRGGPASDWQASAVDRRGRYKLADLIERDQDYLMTLESMDNGKPVAKDGQAYGVTTDMYVAPAAAKPQHPGRTPVPAAGPPPVTRAARPATPGRRGPGTWCCSTCATTPAGPTRSAARRSTSTASGFSPTCRPRSSDCVAATTGAHLRHPRPGSPSW